MGVSSAERKGSFVLDVSFPLPVDDATMAFPVQVIGKLLPFYDDIPAEFKGHGNAWTDLAGKWFFEGLSAQDLQKPKTGVGRTSAIRHLSACIRSYQPSHEHKTAGIAYLMSLWFDL